MPTSRAKSSMVSTSLGCRDMLAITVSMTMLSYLSWAWAIICQVRITLCVVSEKTPISLGNRGRLPRISSVSSACFSPSGIAP